MTKPTFSVKSFFPWIALSLLVCLSLSGAPKRAYSQVIDLSGPWSCRLDREDRGEKEKWFLQDLPEKVRLPGSLPENGLGDDISVDTQWTGRIADRSWYTDPKYAKYRKPGNVKIPFWLTPIKHYVGRAWYSRSVDIPAAWKGKHITLFLERCHWETRVWVDGKECGFGNSLSTPNVYDLSQVLQPGTHRLTLYVDNRIKINVGVNAHSVSDHTQTNWNGVVGTLCLEARDPVWIEDVQVYPDPPQRKAVVQVAFVNRTGRAVEGVLTLEARSFNSERDHRAETLQKNVLLPEGACGKTFTYELGPKALLWDEFHPNLYRLMVGFSGGGLQDRKTVSFGLRSFRTQGTRFTINGRPTFLRGTLECCIFPLTGYPPCDVESWLKILRRARAHGLNHLRFHSWCPPEAAFEAADRMGFYYHVECAAWTAVGDGGALDRFIYEEADRILRFYGNHPSFCMLAYGNEPGGKNKKRYLGKLVEYWKKKDARRLYTSAAGWPMIPENQYHVTPRPRVHQWGSGLRCRFNARPPETATDYRDFVSRWKVPVVSHEIGQWCVYPNFKEIGKYTGVLRAGNFEIFRDTLRENGMLSLASDFLRASGKLQALCYKEEIESALRTPGFGGFELLQLHDFPGQGTALVGVLDAFWDSKGYITAREFHRFCCETVPLARMTKRTWTTRETFRAGIEIAHHGPEALRKTTARWRIRGEDGKIYASGELPAAAIPVGGPQRIGEISFPLASLPAPLKLNLELTLPGTPYANDWDFWVYPPAEPPAIPPSVHVAEYLDKKTEQVLEKGGDVLLLPAPGTVVGDEYGEVPPGFSPIFWNTAWTHRQPPHTLGILCDPSHPLFKRFPTAYHSDWQWWDLVTKSRIMIIDKLPRDLKPLLRVIDDWFTNRRLALVFEAKVGKGRLLVCGIDLKRNLSSRPAACQFLRSLSAYMTSPAFSPKTVLPVSLLRSLQRKPALKTAARIIEADSEAAGYEARNVLDRDAKTIWHTPWGPGAPGYPHSLTIDLGRPFTITGFRYLPRQDMANGRISGYAFYLSRDGKNWGKPAAAGKFPPGRRGVTIKLRRRRRMKARYVRFVALSPLNPAQVFASAAEIEILVEEDGDGG